MGNSASEHHHQGGRFFRPENLSNDPTAFRVFIKKKNKFIPGWLKVNDDEILFMRGSSHFQCWSLAHLRRYGYTCSGVFFFESGRRCATGEGLHTFQSHQAERIFHMVQSKIKIEEYARYSRLGTTTNNNTPVRVNSLVPAPLAPQRIHPVQRFSSEGAPSPCNVPTPTVPTAPPPYTALYQEVRRAQQNASPSCPSVISAVSTVAGANCCTNRVERPRSVVSNIEHGTAIHPHRTLRPHAINGNTSSSTLNQHFLRQQQHGYITPSIPSQMHHSLAISASGSCLMDASFHSALDANGSITNGGWASQQQLERGEIVMEHVLGNNEDSASTGGRRRLLGSGRHISSNQQQRGTLPLRVPVPPPVQSTSDYNNQSLSHSCAACSPSNLSNNNCPPPPPPPRDQKRLKTHAYVNVDLKTSKGQSSNLSVRELQQQQKNNTSTDRRMEFLISGPGAFQLSSPNRPCAISNNSLQPPSISFNTNSSTPSCSAFSPTSSPMQHSFHAFCPINNNENLQQQFQTSPYSLSPYRQQQQNQQQLGWSRREIEDPCHRLMSQSISGALPPSPSGIFPYNGNGSVNNNDSRQLSLYGKTSNSLEQIATGRTAAAPVPLPLQYSTTKQQNGYRTGSRQQLLQPNNEGGGGSSSCSTLITSSTNTMGGDL
uniref:IRS-type PTB domain-containing protein n=2 Tax=Meloidogyne incognita group TaxID=654580 RepID=A0A914KNH2_MELIC